MLTETGIEQVIDVRSFPHSRKNPDYNLESLPTQLAPVNIGYKHVPELGGRRGKTKAVPAELNAYWRNQSFHNYADYALSESFRRGLSRLIELGCMRRCAIMCSEAVWWRCHRRIIADYLIHDGAQVFHMMAVGRVQPAVLTAAAIARGHKQLSYPATSEPDICD